MEIAPKIKDATEAAQQVPLLFDAILKVLMTPYGLILFIGLLVWFVVNIDYSRLFDLLDRKERKRFEHFDSYIAKSGVADSEAVKVVRDFRDAYYFKIATGIYAEKKLRSALIQLYENTSHLVSWTHIRRAHQYIKIDVNGNASVREFTLFEEIGYWYNKAVGFVLFLLAAAFFSYFVLSNLLTLSSIVLGISSALFIIIFAMFVFAQNWPEDAAKCIKNELDKQTPTQASETTASQPHKN